MKKAISCRKRPCRICRRWFSPDPRLKDRQMTCGEKACKREWHRRKCAEWNKENSGLIKKERLANRLKAIASRREETNDTDQVPRGPTPLPFRRQSRCPLLACSTKTPFPPTTAGPKTGANRRQNKESRNYAQGPLM